MMIERTFDASWLNNLANHPTIKPHVSLGYEGYLDVTPLVSEDNYFLKGEHGAILFHHIDDGLYERHVQVLPEGRGKWAIEFTKACYNWMFDSTDCETIMVKSPSNNQKSRALCVRTGMNYYRTLSDYYGKSIDAHVYLLKKD